MKTILAPLRLHGLGTPQVESLASFYCRLADAHQVTPKQLAKVVFNESAYLSIDDAPELKSIDLDVRIFCTHSGRTAVIALVDSHGCSLCHTLIASNGNKDTFRNRQIFFRRVASSVNSGLSRVRRIHLPGRSLITEGSKGGMHCESRLAFWLPCASHKS